MVVLHNSCVMAMEWTTRPVWKCNGNHVEHHFIEVQRTSEWLGWMDGWMTRDVDGNVNMDVF